MTSLYCKSTGITKLDFSPVPNLTKLDCSRTGITELDLSPVPKLTELDCHATGITELDLPYVPDLSIRTTKEEWLGAIRIVESHLGIQGSGRKLKDRIRHIFVDSVSLEVI